jgi:hypothetical protein
MAFSIGIYPNKVLFLKKRITYIQHLLFFLSFSPFPLLINTLSLIFISIKNSMTPEQELGPAPPPTKSNRKLPPLPAHLAKQYPEKAAAVAAGGGGGGGGQPMMMAAQNGYPMVGGMGPNLVFNFYTPGGGMVCPQPQEEEKKPEGPPPPPVRVQGGPTWCQPRVTVGVGKPVKKEPCCIM